MVWIDHFGGFNPGLCLENFPSSEADMVKDVQSNTLRKKTTAKKSKLQSSQRTPNVVVLLIEAVHHSRKYHLWYLWLLSI